jgi:hypothetical protein
LEYLFSMEDDPQFEYTHDDSIAEIQNNFYISRIFIGEICSAALAAYG